MEQGYIYRATLAHTCKLLGMLVYIYSTPAFYFFLPLRYTLTSVIISCLVLTVLCSILIYANTKYVFYVL